MIIGHQVVATVLLVMTCGACANPRPRPADGHAVRLEIARRALEQAECSYEEARGRAPSSAAEAMTALRSALDAAQLSSAYAEAAIAEYEGGDARAWHAVSPCLARDLVRLEEQLAALQMISPPGLTRSIAVAGVPGSSRSTTSIPAYSAY